MSTPTILLATDEATLNLDIETVDAAQSGSFTINLQFADDDLLLSAPLKYVDLANTGVSVVFDSLSGKTQTIDGSDDFSGLTFLGGGASLGPDVSQIRLSPLEFTQSQDDFVAGDSYDTDFYYDPDDKISDIYVAGDLTFGAVLLDQFNELTYDLFQSSETVSTNIPPSLMIEDGKYDSVDVVGLSAAPLTFVQYLALGPSAATTGDYLLTVTAQQLAGDLNTFNADKSVYGMVVTGGTDLMTAGGIAERYLELASGTVKGKLAVAKLVVDEALLTYTGNLSLVDGVLSISAGDTLKIKDDSDSAHRDYDEGILNINGTLEGKGTLITQDGSTIVMGKGDTVTVKEWLVTGADTNMYAASAQTYAGHFELGSGANVIVGASDSLTLTGVYNYQSSGGTFQIRGDNFPADGTIANGVVTISGMVQSGETFNFVNDGNLDLGDAAQFHGAFSNFQDADEILLASDWNFKSLTNTKDDTILTLRNVAEKQTATLTFDGIYTTGNFLIDDNVTHITPGTAIRFN